MNYYKFSIAFQIEIEEIVTHFNFSMTLILVLEWNVHLKRLKTVNRVICPDVWD